MEETERPGEKEAEESLSLHLFASLTPFRPSSLAAGGRLPLLLSTRVSAYRTPSHLRYSYRIPGHRERTVLVLLRYSFVAPPTRLPCPFPTTVSSIF